MLNSIKKMRAGPSLPSRKAWTGVDWNKIISLCLITTMLFGNALLAMDNTQQLGHQLRLAINAGDAYKVKTLLDRGAPVEHKDAAGVTLLMRAAHQAYPEIVHILIERGAQVDYAITYGYWKKLAIALQSLMGAFNFDDYVAATHNRWTALMWALAGESSWEGREDRFNVVRLLVENRANVNHVGNDGKTPLLIAMTTNNGFPQPEIIRLLIEKGAQIYHADNNGNTAVTLAARAGNASEICKILIDGMIRRTRKQKDVIYTLLLSLQRTSGKEHLSYDTRKMVAKKVIESQMRQNKEQALAEINKIEDENPRQELIQYLNETIRG